MDLMDDPTGPPSSEESWMRAIRKPLILLAACALALVSSRGGPGRDLHAQPGLAAAGSYDLGQLQIVTRALFQVNEAYFDKTRFDPRRMLLGALDHLQREVPELLVDRLPERDPQRVRVRVGSHEQTFELLPVDSPWRLRSTLQQIVLFVRPRLNPGPAQDEAQRLMAVEIAAVNGMLSTLDPHSTLLDVESYREMRTHTQGRFGGVGMSLVGHPRGGIVVRTVVARSPSMRAGIWRGDRIVRIDSESTINMTVDDAVERLRGEVGDRVDVYLERPGHPGQMKLTLVRDTIQLPSVERVRVLTSRALPGQPPARIGYLRIDHFSATTEPDLVAAIDTFERERVKGLILDLRDNPGGLYEQAAKVADAFIGSGTLVSMVGVGGSNRRDEFATAGGYLKLPLAVLVDGRSASASEIVAGAMKNLDRAVVIGDRTFGKGSVQMLFDIPAPARSPGRSPDDPRLGLKLTTAQYLTAGDTSIQGVGVAPDVELTPLLVERRGAETLIRLQKSAHRRQEADLEWSLERARPGQDQPAQSIGYLHVPPPGQRSLFDSEEAEPEEPVVPAGPPDQPDPTESHVDFAMELARDFLAQTRSTSRRQMLTGASAFFDRLRAEQDQKIESALQKLGVDWRAPGGGSGAAGTGPAVLHATLTVLGKESRVPAGETVRIRGVVRNSSSVTAHRVRVVLASPNLLLDENEMVFGRIGPQESRSFDLSVKIPRSSLTRTDIIRAELAAQGPIQASPAEVTLDIQGKPRPLFAYSYRTVDPEGNRDGRVQRGEKVRLLVTVKNIGAGPALRTEAVLRNGPAQPGILITDGRFQIENLAPGASRDLAFAYQVGNDVRRDRYRLELEVADGVLGESISDQIEVGLARAPGAGAVPAAGLVTPPLLTVNAPTVTTGPTVRLTGRALDDQRVRDLYIQVYNRDSKLPPRKVFYLPNRGQPGLLTFDAEVPLRPGSNLIQVFARETDQVKSIVPLVVLQKPLPPRLVQNR
jgi:carboxyl-terminal processing protease